ncbi:hypothetical protein SAMN04487905_102103 [Actinopolyspora xinjiangensis]|uniref:Uncharacterized protein n=1 Tax=Actinopolyspora xinjiangensis TaxID=405564 RepID=A0A1H0Q695_9ACTN|nr:hypothetical protein SAMN04487905_102103 [Actinopolyspora xinjiangensis]
MMLFRAGGELIVFQQKEVCNQPRWQPHRGEGDFLEIKEQYFPILSSKCIWEDGTRMEMIPVYVNPILYAALTLTIICFGAALYFRLHARRKPTKGKIKKK